MDTEIQVKSDDTQFTQKLAVQRAETTALRWLEVDYNKVGFAVSLVIFCAFGVLFLRSGLFVAGVMLNDTLLYTESGYRVAHGQMPGIDFTSAHGVLWYVPLSIAYWLTGDLVRSVPIAFVIFAAIVFILAVYIAVTRLNQIVGIIVTILCSVLVMAPWAIGFRLSPQGSTHTTAAMGYNKLGFTAILLASLLAIKPKPSHSILASRCDALFAVTTFALAFYTKMPFGLGVAGMVFLWACFFARENTQIWKLLGGVIFVMVLLELLIPGIHLGYLGDMIIHATINQAIDVRSIARAAYETSPEIIAVAVLPMLALAVHGYCDYRHVIFFSSLVFGSIILLTQSVQGPLLIAPVAVAIIGISELTSERRSYRHGMAVWSTAAALAFGLSAYFLPAANAVVRHAWFASRSAPIDNIPRAYASLRVPSDIDLKPLDEAFTNHLSGAQAYAAARSTESVIPINALFENEYVHTLTDLPNAQLLCGRAGEQTAILDFANVSSSLLGHYPVGGYAYVHFGRGFSQFVHWPAERMFAGVDCLFDPKLPDAPSSRDGLWLVYGSAITSSFTSVGETTFWRVLVRNGTR